MIGTNLYEFIPHTPLQFQEGDIFGVYSDRTDGKRLFLNEQKESGPINLKIASSLDYAASTISETLIVANNDFPLVTVETSMHFSIFFTTFKISTDISTHFLKFTSDVIDMSSIVTITSVSQSLFSSYSVLLSVSKYYISY